ncbi:hypothetical protein NBH19_17315 [Rhizobium sp. S95]|uniref:Uncharacterized protein n=1 Tax=Ciceribacter sichuanensis TaxID=2949647 RepID=A0AAJ1C3L3_9HYPH|nr:MULTISPECIES: hypothetical protein [unclassified Ciceribacter]MCM2397828.1 hypothetical protein [Ciceribacter sp. S95]MCO5960198.1 hypothetical protein [Ciceribacter sp. S101]
MNSEIGIMDGVARQVGGASGIGAKSLIDEQFNDYKDCVHSVMTTSVLDEREFNFTINAFGTTVGRLIHMHSPGEDGCAFYSETYIGMKVPVLGFLFNWLLLPSIYSRKQGKHWNNHNIEESGSAEDVLPVLYSHAHGE